MAQGVIDPFNSDVAATGRYEYTDPARRSSVYANRHFSEVILRNLAFAGKRVVDVGCGDGTYTSVLRAETQARLVVGIDPADKAIQSAIDRYCGERRDLEFHNCTSADLVRRGERFDIAVYRGVIHHVADPAGEIDTALKLADTVFFIEPNGWNPALKLLERFSEYHRRHGERSYFLGQLRRWIEASGGKVELAICFGLVPMFCPNWFVAVGAAFEPIVERIPLLRLLCCGQVAIRASRREAGKGAA